MRERGEAMRWLQLTYKVPSEPSQKRVWVWRRLQNLGAFALQNSVYLLPYSEEIEKQFRQLTHDIHEMGGVRMGHDPKTSLLNKWNQLHLCKNVFVTDGACMTSTSCQNPTLTYMAMTARAVNYAVEEGKKGNI